MEVFLFKLRVFFEVFFIVQCQQIADLDKLDTIYTNNFTIKIRNTRTGDFKNAMYTAYNEGFYPLYHIVSNYYLFNRQDVPAYSEHPLDSLTIQGYQETLEKFFESTEQSSLRRVSRRQLGRKQNDLHAQRSFDKTDGQTLRFERKVETLKKDDTVGYHNRGGLRSKVIVGVVDVQFDLYHDNYKDNIVHSMCFDFIHNMGYSGINNECYSQLPPQFSHGTHCMGRIAAKNIHGCDAGINPQCSLVALQVISDRMFLSDERLARALVYKLDDIHIYSCSYGAPDNNGFVALGVATKAALKEGIERGRGCKGRIYVFPSGNGHHDNCNADGYANSIDTITIANVDRHGNLSRNKEVCPCALVASEGDGYTTTDICDRCTRGFDGSSASTASGAGYISILLSVNENLTKRDVEHILVRSASKKLLDRTITWYKNGAGLEFNEQIGFGTLNKSHMTELAKSWITVPERHTCSVEYQGPIRINTFGGIHYPLVVSLQSDGCRNTDHFIKHLEHVQLELHIQCSPMSGLLIDLKSPSGTISPLLTKIKSSLKLTNQFIDFHWTFMSVHFWGEEPGGVWQVQYRIQNNAIKGHCTFMSQKLIQHGTSGRPETKAKLKQCIKKDAIQDEDNAHNDKYITLRPKVTVIVIVSCGIVLALATKLRFFCYCLKCASQIKSNLCF